MTQRELLKFLHNLSGRPIIIGRGNRYVICDKSIPCWPEYPEYQEFRKQLDLVRLKKETA